MSEPTVSAGYAKALLDFAVSRGAEEARLIEQSGIRPSSLLDQDNRVPFSSFVTLMRAAKALCRDPALALEFGAASDFRKFSIVGLLSHAAADMGEALVQLNRYGRLVMEVEGLGDGPRFEIVQANGERWLIDRRSDANDFPEMTEAVFSRFICWTRREFPQATFALSVQVTHPPPAHRAAYDRLWRVPVTFGGERNAIQTSLDWAAVAVQPESRYVFGVLTERGDALLRELESSKTVRARVESLLLARLHTGELSIDTIAGLLAVSRQTLYRRLKAEGATFERVLDELRHRMALSYLSGRQVSVSETAYLVGFSDPAVFSRAFKRWTGRSPRAMRLPSN